MKDFVGYRGPLGVLLRAVTRLDGVSVGVGVGVGASAQWWWGGLGWEEEQL